MTPRPGAMGKISIANIFEMPSMAEMITQRARQLNLGASWNHP
jgi:hypothetical protein